MDSKIIKLRGNSYTINFPNVGQILDIESLKSALSNGTYGDLVKNNTKSSNQSLDLIDAIATFSVLIPELKNILEVKSYLDLDLKTAKMVVNSYNKDYFLWFKELNDEIQKIGDEE